MRLTTTLLILAAGVAVSVAVWFLSGGRFFLFLLPIVFAAPLLWRGGRKGG